MARQKKHEQTNTVSPEELEELKRRIDEENAWYEKRNAETPPTDEYLKSIQETHKDPYWMSYEVVQLKTARPVQTVFTSESYHEALEVFNKYFGQDKHARLDLVVRQVRDGMPLFRTVALEMEVTGAHGNTDSKGRPSFSSSYNETDWGRFGPSVYNHTYKDAKWAGYEAYNPVVKTFDYT